MFKKHMSTLDPAAVQNRWMFGYEEAFKSKPVLACGKAYYNENISSLEEILIKKPDNIKGLNDDDAFTLMLSWANLYEGLWRPIDYIERSFNRDFMDVMLEMDFQTDRVLCNTGVDLLLKGDTIYACVPHPKMICSKLHAYSFKLNNHEEYIHPLLLTSRQIDVLKRDITRLHANEISQSHELQNVFSEYVEPRQLLELANYIERLKPIGKVINLVAPGNDHRYISRMNNQKVPVAANFHVRYFDM